jgi:prevent-host-death family protein
MLQLYYDFRRYAKGVAFMLQVNIGEAKTNLSGLVERAANGEEFIIAKAGKPMAKVVPFSPPNDRMRGLGFLKGHVSIPDDFDTMMQDEIIAMFEGDDEIITKYPAQIIFEAK